MKKIFEKLKGLTVIDMIVVSLFIVAIASFFIFYSRKKAVVYVSTMNSFQDWTEYTPPYPYWISNSIKVGDKSYDSFGGEKAEVINVNNSEFGGDRRFLRLSLKTNALYNKRTNIYFLEDQPLLVGNKISLDLGDTHYEGVIKYVGTVPEDQESDFSWAEVSFLSERIQPWLALKYNTDVSIKDTGGEEIFKILSSRTEQALIHTYTSDGRVLLKRDPYLKDVYFTAKLKLKCVEGICYYNEIYPIRVGSKNTYFSDKLLLDGNSIMIQDIKILNKED